MVATVARMGRPRKAEPTDPLRIPASVVKRIRKIALHLDMDPGDYVASRLAPILAADDAKRVEDERKERERREQSPAEKKPKK